MGIASFLGRMRARWRQFQLDASVEWFGPDAEYHLTQKCFLDGHLVEPMTFVRTDRLPSRTKIRWAGVPNHAMVPVNRAANRVHKAFARVYGEALPTIDFRKKYAPSKKPWIIDPSHGVLLYDHPNSVERRSMH